MIEIKLVDPVTRFESTRCDSCRKNLAKLEVLACLPEERENEHRSNLVICRVCLKKLRDACNLAVATNLGKDS